MLCTRRRPWHCEVNAGRDLAAVGIHFVLDCVRGLQHNTRMKTHIELVALYKKIILMKKVILDDFTVAAMRNAAPGQREMNALNDALKELGYQR